MQLYFSNYVQLTMVFFGERAKIERPERIIPNALFRMNLIFLRFAHSFYFSIFLKTHFSPLEQEICGEDQDWLVMYLAEVTDKPTERGLNYKGI